MSQTVEIATPLRFFPTCANVFPVVPSVFLGAKAIKPVWSAAAWTDEAMLAQASSSLPPSLPIGVKRPISFPLPRGVLLQNIAGRCWVHMHAWMSSYTHRHAQCTYPCTHKHSNIYLKEAKTLKCTRCLCFICRNGFSLVFFHPRRWKGLGQQESMAQTTPRVSASQWQITVPSPKLWCLKEANHSVFSLLWKGTWLFWGSVRLS